MTDRIAFVLLAALVFTLPWEKSVTVPGIGTLTRLVGVLALFAGILAAILRGKVRRPNLALAIVVLFAGWSALTCFWSYNPGASSSRAFTYVQLLAMVWLIWDLCRTRARQHVLLQAYVWGAAAASAITLARYFQNLQTYYRRYAAPGFDPNDFAITIAMAIPIALYLALRSRAWTAWIYRGAVALLSAAILLTASRTGLIAAYAAFGFAVLTWRISSPAQRVSAVILLLAFALGPVRLAPPEARQRLSTIQTEITTGTLHNRTTIWKAGARVFRHRPLQGVGAGAYPDAVRPLIGVPGVPGHEYVAHNTFLSVLVETGLIGFAIYGLLLGILLIYLWAMRLPEAALWSTVLLVWAIGASTLTWEQRKPWWFVAALLMAMWALAFRETEEPAS